MSGPVIGTPISSAGLTAEIAQLRRMINEPTTATYSDATLEDYIEAHAVADERGVQPFEMDFSTTPPTRTAVEQWIATYDLNAAAAQLWEEKAAAVASGFAFTADGATHHRDQRYQQYMQMAQRYRSKSVPGALKFASTQRALSPTGIVVETSQIIDRYEDDQVFNT